MLDQAITTVRNWDARNLSVAINISARNLADERWYHDAIEMIENAGIDPGRLDLELTESVLMQDPEQAVLKLNAIAETGANIVIDDFGTGYSSLSYLRRLPISKLKIDRSFVTHLEKRPKDRRLVESIISLAHSLDLVVTAEGVENQTVMDALQAMGCNYAQGFHISHPLSWEKLEDLLADRS